MNTLIQYTGLILCFFSGVILFFVVVYITARMASLGVLKTLEKGVEHDKKSQKIRQQGPEKKNERIAKEGGQR